MGEFDKIKDDLTGQPVPYHSSTDQVCKRCFEINDVVRKYGAPSVKDHVLQGGDEIIFRVSRRTPEHPSGEDSEYYVSPHVIHFHHHDEYGEQYQLSRGTRGEHNAIIHAVVEQTGFDFGKQLVDKLDMEYKPDVDQEALTLSQVDVLGYSSPIWGEEEVYGEGLLGSGEEPPEPVVGIDVPAFWPEELQYQVFEYIKSHQ